ncbi:MAG TPA: hypothetical protein VFE62_07845 [Gemmataceae bacterium]|nr:hypothetical protein [Gemmataceae bacterium]
MRQFVYLIAAGFLATIPFQASGQNKQDRDEILAAMMQKKLKSAHLVLDGVVIADFKKIQTGGDDLIKLAKSETWQLIRSPLYERHSADFVARTENLVKKAKEKNIDGAALAYVEVTLSCVRCHDYVRERRRDARVPGDLPKIATLDPRR